MELDIQQILLIIKKKWKIFVVCGLLGMALAFLFATYMVAPKYTSQVSFFAYVKNDTSVVDGTSGAAGATTQNTYAIKMIPTYLTFLQTNDFYENLKNQSGINLNASALKSAITYKQTTDTAVFTASVTTVDPDTSKTIADLIAESVPQVINETNDGLVLVKVIDPPVKGGAVKASYPKYCAIGLILGLALAFAYALLRNMLDVHLKTEEDLTTRYDIPLLGAVPKYEDKIGRRAGK